MSDQAEPAAASDGAHDTMTKRTTTGMLDLPAELLVHIASNLKKKDILNFRQLRHELTAAAEDQFISEYFTERQHLLEVHSLEGLKDITADRRLIRRLRKLVFVPAVLGDLFLCLQCYRSLPAACPWQTCEPDCTNAVDIWNNFDHERTVFDTGGKGASLLRDCLSNIKNAAITPEIALDEGSSCSCDCPFARRECSGYGRASFDRKLGIHGTMLFDSLNQKQLTSFNESLVLILKAFCSTGFPIKSLSLLKAVREKPAPLSLENDLPTNLLGPLETLERLHIQGGSLLSIDSLDALAELFSRAPSPSRLSLRLDTGGGATEVAWAMLTFPSNSLEQLEIISGELGPFCDLRPLLMKHQKSLTPLSFRETHFYLASEYSQAFAEQLHLSHFETSGLTFLGPSMKQLKFKNRVTGPDVKKWLLEKAEYFKERERIHEESNGVSDE